MFDRKMHGNASLGSKYLKESMKQKKKFILIESRDKID